MAVTFCTPMWEAKLSGSKTHGWWLFQGERVDRIEVSWELYNSQSSKYNCIGMYGMCTGVPCQSCTVVMCEGRVVVFHSKEIKICRSFLNLHYPVCNPHKCQQKIVLSHILIEVPLSCLIHIQSQDFFFQPEDALINANFEEFSLTVFSLVPICHACGVFLCSLTEIHVLKL